jgi:hypothetical protein
MNQGEIRYLYARIRARARRAIGPGRSRRSTWGAPLQEGTEFGLETCKRGIEQLAARHDDDVEAGGRLVMAEQLAHAPLGPVSNHGRPELAGGGDAQPRMWTLRCVYEHGHQAAMVLAARIVDPGVLAALPDVLLGAKRAGLAQSALAFVGDGEALAALRAPTLQDQTAVLRGHPHQKAMGLLPAARIRLVCTLTLCHSSIVLRTSKCSRLLIRVSTHHHLWCRQNRADSGSKPADRGPASRGQRACFRATVNACSCLRGESAVAPREGSRAGFPHLWKTLWKSARNRYLFRGNAHSKAFAAWRNGGRPIR